jgi:hypothetical protein
MEGAGRENPLDPEKPGWPANPAWPLTPLWLENPCTRTVLRICRQRQRNGHQTNGNPEHHQLYFTPDRFRRFFEKSISPANRLRYPWPGF